VIKVNALQINQAPRASVLSPVSQ